MPDFMPHPSRRRHHPNRREILSRGTGRFPLGYPVPSGMRRDGHQPPTPQPRSGALPPLAVIALNRIAFGPRPGDIAAFNALGGNDTARLTAYVDQQLDPGSINDAACDARIAASSYGTLGKTLTELFQDHHLASPPDWEVRQQPAYETEMVTWTRAIWSERQLFESMVHFWHNHFSVYAFEFVEAPVWVHYDRDVIRANALGNFRDFLEDVAQSPAMLLYLDNYSNFADGGIGYSNENFARELIELHTMGAAVSYGNTPTGSIPTDGNGVPIGYNEDDVKDVARALTGWTFDIDWIPGQGGTTGEFVYRDDYHSTEAKNVVGTAIASGGTAAIDGGLALDALASHPATGRFLASKLCRRFIGDFPPQSIVDSTAALFTSQWQAPDQIRQVVRHILLSNEFRTTWGEKIKRPFEIIASMMRGTDADFRFMSVFPYPDDWNNWPKDMQDTSTFGWRYDKANHIVFGWHPPNGHPDVRAAWQSASPRVACWRMVNWLVESEDAGESWRLPVIAQTPPGVRSANAMVDYWTDRCFGRPLTTTDRDELVDFMAAGFNPDLDLPLDTDDDVQNRLRSFIALLYMSPESLWR